MWSLYPESEINMRFEDLPYSVCKGIYVFVKKQVFGIDMSKM